MKFNYQARTKEGQIQKGVVEAATEEAALMILQKYGLFITFLEVIKPAPVYAKQIKLFKRISPKDVVVFARQLSIMFRSQVPIVEALLAIAKQADNPEFKERIIKISEEVEGGTPLSSAFSLYPNIFSSFFINMVKSGEASGKLSESLDYLADHLESDYNFKSKIIGAMIYPLFVLVVFFAVLFLMVFWIVPPITQILIDSGQDIPFITKFVIAFSNFIKDWIWLLILIAAGTIYIVSRYLKTSEGKIFFDRIILKTPLLGKFFKKVYLTRFAENLSTLISGGLPIARALEISGEVVGNSVYKEIIFKTRDEVRKGEVISRVLESHSENFPPLFVQMVVVGEKTGKLESSLGNVVNFYQKDVDKSLDGLISILEPAMIIVLAVMITGLLASVLLPIYQMGAF